MHFQEASVYTYLPVVLGLQELKFIFDSITRLGHSELEARLARLVRGLEVKEKDVH